MRTTAAHYVGVLLVLATALSGPGAAQPGRRLESPPNRTVVTTIGVKPEMLDEWLSLQKSAVIPALKKAGIKTRTVYTSGIFGKAFEYTIVQPLNRFSDLDAPEMQAEALGSVSNPQLAAKLRRCVAGTSTFLSTDLPDLGNPGPNVNPPIVQFLRLHVANGKMEEYQNLYREEVVPALRKANANVRVASRRLGTDGNDLTFETPMARFADLDAPPPLLKALGPVQLAKITEKLNGLATVMENTILTRVPDLSY